MNNTFILFEDRKAEIEFYYSIMMDIENNTGKIQTILESPKRKRRKQANVDSVSKMRKTVKSPM